MKHGKKVVLLTTILVFGSVSHAMLLPKPFNETSHWIRNFKDCQEAQCIVDWIQDENAAQRGNGLLNSNCSEFSHKAQSMIILFTTQKVQRELIDVYYQYRALMYCPKTCTIQNVGKMPLLLLSFQLEFARLYKDDEVVKKECKWPFDYCKWWSYHVQFSIFFGLFALPTTIILNVINMSTITKLISAHQTPAASLYFHKAEIYTDVCCSVVFYLWNNLYFFSAIDYSLQICLPAIVSFISSYHFSSAVLNLLMFINQCTLYNLVSDRCASLRDPLTYYAVNGRATARKRQTKTVGISFVLFVPLLLIYLFYPLFEFWRKQTKYLDHLATMLTAIYALAPLFCVLAQIVKGMEYQKLYEGQLNSTTMTGAPNEQERSRIKRNEKEKRLLLIGTVGLNIVASSVNMLLSMLESHFIQIIFGLVWWVNVLYVLSSLCVFMNGTGSFIIHVILLKPYRSAFWETLCGKAISKIANKLSSHAPAES